MTMLVFIAILGAGYFIYTRPASAGKKVVMTLLVIGTLLWLAAQL